MDHYWYNSLFLKQMAYQKKNKPIIDISKFKKDILSKWVNRMMIICISATFGQLNTKFVKC